MNPLFEDEVRRAFEELRGYEDNGGRAVTDFGVLLAGEVDQDLARWVRNFEEGEDGRAVVGDRDVLEVDCEKG